MYVIERLKNEFPECAGELDVYDKYLLEHHGDPEINTYRIFDDQKPNFHFVHEAYQYVHDTGKHGKEFNKLMAQYEKSLNNDKDFLAFFVHRFWDIDGRQMTVEELQKIIDEKFKAVDNLKTNPTH